MPSNRYVLKKEKAMSTALSRVLRAGKKELIDILNRQETKAFSDDIKAFLTKLIDKSTKVVIDRLKPIINKGAKNKINPKFKIDWNLRNEPAVKYLNDLEILYLSQNKGSIAKTTTDDILKILSTGLDEGLTYKEIAKQINETDPLVFSKARSELIAVTEVGRAYEFGKLQPMEDLQRQGNIVLKKWQTVEDDRVRESHRQNQRDGYIPLDVNFSGTGDKTAPAKNKDPWRCRCSTIYKVV